MTVLMHLLLSPSMILLAHADTLDWVTGCDTITPAKQCILSGSKSATTIVIESESEVHDVLVQLDAELSASTILISVPGSVRVRGELKAQSISVTAGERIQVEADVSSDGRGYSPGTGPGAGDGGGTSCISLCTCVGGNPFISGGRHVNANEGAPWSFGSGGGNFNGNGGGYGGGRIKLEAAQAIELRGGNVQSRGLDGRCCECRCGWGVSGGGGAGGSIQLAAPLIAGSGRVSVSGGSVATGRCSGGEDGYISVRHTGMSDDIVLEGHVAIICLDLPCANGFQHQTTCGCVCSGEWSGLDCAECKYKVCGPVADGDCSPTSPCSGHGSCNTATAVCECDAPWFGSSCDIYCDSIVTCGGLGTCNTEGACVCVAGKGGPDCLCDTADPCSKADNCNNHGDCDSAGACVCHAGWLGCTCRVFCAAADTCSGHGRCKEDGSCECDNGYVGDDCACADIGIYCSGGTQCLPALFFFTGYRIDIDEGTVPLYCFDFGSESSQPRYSDTTGRRYHVPEMLHVVPESMDTYSDSNNVFFEVREMHEQQAKAVGLSFANGMYGVRSEQDSMWSQNEQRTHFFAQYSRVVTVRRAVLFDTISLSPRFEAAVADLPIEFDQESYIRFLQTWGTHYVSAITTGGELVSNTLLDRCLQNTFSTQEIAEGIQDNFFALFGPELERETQQSSVRTAISSRSTSFTQKRGGDAVSDLEWAEWVESVDRSPAVLRKTLAPLWSLVPDRQRSANMQRAYQQLLASIRADTPNGQQRNQTACEAGLEVHVASCAAKDSPLEAMARLAASGAALVLVLQAWF